MKIKNFRWWIAGLLAVVTAINYLDRQNFPLVYAEINKVIPISDWQVGFINSLFLLMYGTMYAVGGRIVDVLRTRIGYALMATWWSVANIFHAFVSSITGLGISRFFLGAGEGGGFPASAKVVSEWFPKKGRSYTFGIFNTGSSIGAIIAPLLILFIVGTLGSWRWTFVIFFFGLAMMGHQFWSTIVQTLAVDLFPSKIVGTVSGLIGCIGTYGAMLFSVIIGFIIEHGGYTPAFIISGILHPISFILIFIIIQKIEPVRLLEIHKKRNEISI